MGARHRRTAKALLLLGTVSAVASCAATRPRAATESATVDREVPDGAPAAARGAVDRPTGAPCVAMALPAEWEVTTLADLWALGPTDVLAVADGRAIVRFDGARWTREHEIDDPVHLVNDIFVPPGGHPIAVGQLGLVLRHDGTAWRQTLIPCRDNLFGVWATADDRALAVTSGGQTYRLQDGRWRMLDPTGVRRALFAVWGARPDDLFAVGDGGTILRFDGTRWRQQPSPTEELLTGLWGSGPRDLFAVGSAGTVLHFDGAAWTPQPTGAEEFILTDVWGSGPSDVWAVGRTPDPADDDLFGPPPEPRGVLLYYDGASWRRAWPAVDLVPISVFGAGYHDLYLAGFNGPPLRCDTRGFTF